MENASGQTACECGYEQTIKHPLVHPIQNSAVCTHHGDLEEFNPELDHAPIVTREEEVQLRIVN